MTTAPTWADSGQGDLLELVARGNVATTTADAEWDLYVEALRTVAIAHAGDICPNALRKRVRGLVAPKRLGAFVSRALARDLIVPTDRWTESDDREGRNAGRPARIYRAQLALYREAS